MSNLERFQNLVKRIAATLGEPTPAHGEALPPLWHWAFFQEPVFESGLGGDGHPARGGFLPPADNRNRMWAGSRLEFIEPLKVGGEVTRTSTILDVQEKHGRTGSLLFVTVRHDHFQDGRLALRDEQDIVYREPTPPSCRAPSNCAAAPGWKPSNPAPHCCSATRRSPSTAIASTTTGPTPPSRKAIRGWWCMGR